MLRLRTYLASSRGGAAVFVTASAFLLSLLFLRVQCLEKKKRTLLYFVRRSAALAKETAASRAVAFFSLLVASSSEIPGGWLDVQHVVFGE